jgi:demethoxyubiquinone hydroxylase (CLK1/Coq7/Cat5 family)
MIEASQRMIRVNSQEELGGMNPVVKRHFEPQIKTLQNAPRDVDKLERLLKVKERQKEEAMHISDTLKGWLQKRLKCSMLYCIWWRGKADDYIGRVVKDYY